MNIKQIIADWNAKMLYSEIMYKHRLTGEQAYAIIECSGGLSTTEIEARLQGVRPGMSALEIEAIMEGTSCTNS